MRQPGFRGLLTICLLFVSPVVVLLLFIVGDILIPVILLLYVIVIIEGAVLAIWIVSKIHADESSTRLIREETRQHYSDRNRAETLTVYVRSAVKKRSSYFQQHSRSEIAKVMKHVLEGSPSRNRLLLIKEPYSNEDELVPNRESTLSVELDFLLHPEEESNNKKAANEKQKREVLQEEPRPAKPRLGYLASLEHVLSEIESSR
jgi:hypothetical protein